MARSPASAKSDNINIRVSPETLGVIDRAAGISDKNRTDFILDVVRKAAEDALLGQRLFVLDSLEWDEFQAVPDAPVRPNPKLERFIVKWKQFCRSRFSSGGRRLATGIPQGTSEPIASLLAERCPALRVGRYGPPIRSAGLAVDLGYDARRPDEYTTPSQPTELIPVNNEAL